MWKKLYNIVLLSIQILCAIVVIIYLVPPIFDYQYDFVMFMFTIVSLDLVCWSVYQNLKTCKCDICGGDLDGLNHNAPQIFTMLTLIAGILFFTFFNLEIGVIVLLISMFIKIVTI